MKRLYFGDEHGCSEAYRQQIILIVVYGVLSVAGATLSAVVISASSEPFSIILTTGLKLDIRPGILDQAWIIKWMSGHELVSHCFGKLLCIW